MPFDTGSSEAEILQTKGGIEALEMVGATRQQKIDYLVKKWGYREDIAANEVDQGYPLFEQLKEKNRFDDTGKYE